MSINKKIKEKTDIKHRTFVTQIRNCNDFCDFWFLSLAPVCFCELILFVWVVCLFLCLFWIYECVFGLYTCVFFVFVCMHLLCMCISLCSCVVEFVYLHFVVFVCGGVCVLAIINWNCSHQGAGQTLVRCSMHQSLLLFLETRKVIEAMRSLTIQPHPSPHLAIHAFNFHPLFGWCFSCGKYSQLCVCIKKCHMLVKIINLQNSDYRRPWSATK